MASSNEIYQEVDQKRAECVRAVVASASRRKIVVAGPGTGKTTLFKHVLAGKKKTLTLTFVNSLVDDLSFDLAGASDVKTLHSFAYEVVKRFFGKDELNVFPKLSLVIEDDAAILIGDNSKFDRLFHERQDAHPLIAFYSKRRRYYDNHFGFTDLVFAAAKYLESDENLIPTYGQVVVDEFQDFNALEVSLIELLGKRSPVLVAGDDDQALYDFKQASTKHIRERFAEDSGWERFTLPYCGRCTKVIVGAVNDLIQGATKAGHLTGRVSKDFHYFDCESKDADSVRFPKIVHAQVYDKQMPWFVESQIAKLAKELRTKFSVLVICPTAGKCEAIAEGLRLKGFRNVDYAKRRDNTGVTVLDGLKILRDSKDSNLGWRIVAKGLLDENSFAALLKESDGNKAPRVRDLLSNEARKRVDQMLAVLRALEEDEPADLDIVHSLLAPDKTPYDIGVEALSAKLEFDAPAGGIPGIRNVPIRVTTIQSSKGLAEDFVFLTHFDDRFYLSEQGTKVTDLDLCKAVVAMTRAKRRLYLLSATEVKPTFLNWMTDSRFDFTPGAKHKG